MGVDRGLLGLRRAPLGLRPDKVLIIPNIMWHSPRYILSGSKQEELFTYTHTSSEFMGIFLPIPFCKPKDDLKQSNQSPAWVFSQTFAYADPKQGSCIAMPTAHPQNAVLIA